MARFNGDGLPPLSHNWNLWRRAPSPLPRRYPEGTGSIPSPTVRSGDCGFPPLSHDWIQRWRAPSPHPQRDLSGAGSLPSPTVRSSGGGLPLLSHGWIQWRWAPPLSHDEIWRQPIQIELPCSSGGEHPRSRPRPRLSSGCRIFLFLFVCLSINRGGRCKEPASINRLTEAGKPTTSVGLD